MGGVNVNYNGGGVVDEVKKIGRIVGFPEFTQPFNEMIKVDIPGVNDVFEITYTTPNEEVEILALTVTCSGYGETDKYDMFVNESQWFKNWYISEIKEGLFLGTSTFVYRTPANTTIKLLFHNNSSTSKTLWLGIRMLISEDQSKGGTT